MKSQSSASPVKTGSTVSSPKTKLLVEGREIERQLLEDMCAQAEYMEIMSDPLYFLPIILSDGHAGFSTMSDEVLVLEWLQHWKELWKRTENKPWDLKGE